MQKNLQELHNLKISLLEESGKSHDVRIWLDMLSSAQWESVVVLARL